MPYRRSTRRKAPVYRRVQASRKAGAMRRAGGRSKYRKMLVQQINTPLGGASSSLWSFGQKRKLSARVRMMKSAGAPNTYVWNGGFNCNVSQAIQRYYGFNSVTQGHIEDIMQIAGNQSAFNRVCLENAISALSLTNITNTSAEIDIYDVIFKRDVPDTLSVSLPPNVYTVTGASVPDLINVGVNAARTLATGASGSFTIGTNPWDSQFFKEYCQVVKRTRVMLASGATHRHSQSVNLSKVISQVVGSNSTIDAVRGYTYATLVRINGAPAYIPTGDLSTLGAPADITCQAVYSLRVKYTFIQDVTSSVTVSDDLGNNFTAPGTTTRNPGSGVLEPTSP